MHTRSVLRVLAWCAPALAGSAVAHAEPQLVATVEIPRLDALEYHRPYVAVWLEGADRSLTANLAVWYDVDMKADEGETWLKDLRQWWRKSGRELDLPLDGVSGPTRPVGTHEVILPAAVTARLTDGEYTLVVEAAREVGGRELVRVPFQWSRSGPVNVSAHGERELGAITLQTR